MILYHISQVSGLDKIGLKPGMPSKINYKGRRSFYVYLGTLEYIHKDYLSYCPPGQYFLYSVDTTGLALDDNLPGGQYRYGADIPGNKIKLVRELVVGKKNRIYS